MIAGCCGGSMHRKGDEGEHWPAAPIAPVYRAAVDGGPERGPRGMARPGAACAERRKALFSGVARAARAAAGDAAACGDRSARCHERTRPSLVTCTGTITRSQTARRKPMRKFIILAAVGLLAFM